MNDFPSPMRHNRRDYGPDIRREIAEALEPFAKRRDEFIAAAGRVIVRSLDEAARATDLLGMADEVKDKVKERRKEISDPHFEAHRLAIAEAERFWEACDEAMNGVLEKVNAYTDRRKEMIAAQKREQEAAPPAEAAPRAPRATVDYSNAAPAAKTEPEGVKVPPTAAKEAQIKGDYGYKLVSSKDFMVEVTDWREVPPWIMEAEAVQEAIRKVALGIVRQTKAKAISGLKIIPVDKNSVRR